MAVRMTTLVLVGVCLAGSPALGQGLHHGHDHGGGNPWDAPDARPGGMMPSAPSGPGLFPPGMYDPTAVVPAGGMMPPPGMMPGGGMMPLGGMMPPGGVVPTGGTMPPHMMGPGGMPPGMMPMPGHPGMPQACNGDCPEGGCPTGECSNDRYGWLNGAWSLDNRIVRSLRERVSGGHVRFEWLNYEIEDPGDVLLGEQPTVVTDPRREFLAFDLASPPNQIGTARVPTTSSIFLRDIPGGRLVYSQPVALGNLEVAAWMTEQASDQFIALPLPLNPITNQPRFLATSTLLNGNPSNSFQFYDDSYNLEYTSELWGAGARLLLEGSQGKIIRLRPTVGWRYFSVQESMVQNATFRQTNLFNPAASGTQFSNLRSEVFNNVMGVEFGVQAEAQWWIFAIGVDPAITLGPNISKTRTTTNQFVSIADPLRIVESNGYDFSPVLELGAYARVQLHEHVEFRAGYDAMWFLRVQRASRAVTYDIDGSNNTSLVRPNDSLEELGVDGLSLSLIFHFPVCCDVSDGWRR